MKIGVLIVTYNRLEKLKIALRKFDNQIYQPCFIIVVNNNSSDGTKDFLNSWAINDNRIVINMPKNLGGSGGFEAGMRESLSRDYDWLWVSDDDAFPREDALLSGANFIKENDSKNISAVCGAVINDGVIDYEHRRIIYKNKLKIVEKNSTKSDYLKESFKINAFSYVGVLIRKESLESAGLTNRNFFIWYDDTEHSLRLSKVGDIVCVPSIKIDHNTENKNISNELSWKTYYGLRNRVYTYAINFPKIYSLRFVLKILVLACFQLLTGDLERFFVYVRAAGDGLLGNLGANSIYKPGWTSKNMHRC